MIASERLYLNKAKNKIVKHGNVEAASLLCCAGGKIPAKYQDMAKELSVPENKELKSTNENKGSGLTINKIKKDK